LIDETHKSIIFDNNKCVLCGKCINLTQNMTGEGLLDYLYRGFCAKVSTLPGTHLGETKADFVGTFIDVCPTGAFSEKPPLIKPGPWRTKLTPTICNQCGIGCEMDVETYGEMPVRVRGREESWNFGLVCDRARFERKWADRIIKPMKRVNDEFIDVKMDEARAIVGNHMDNLAIVLTPEVTIEEAERIAAIADTIGARTCGIYENGRSTAKYEDILGAKSIKIDANLNDYPVLKAFLHMAKVKGMETSSEDYELAILQAPSKPEDVPTLILHHGVNEVGLLELGIPTLVEAKNYLVVGNLDEKLHGFTMVMGNSRYADLLLPIPAWIEREGTIVNSEGSRLHLAKALEGEGLVELFSALIGFNIQRTPTV